MSRFESVGPEEARDPEFPPPPSRDELSRLDMEWLGGEGPMAAVAVSSRVRAARNLKGFRFPPAAAPEELLGVRSRVLAAARREAALQSFHVVDTARLERLELGMLMEKRLLSPLHVHMAQAPGRAVMIAPRGALCVMINEEDHLRLQGIVSGLDLDEAWRRVSTLDDVLEAHLEFAYSDQLGYLASCPTNLGTGLRASVMLHLPALALANALEAVRGQIGGQVGVAVRGIFGEGSGIQGNLLQISNQITLGPTEEDLVEKVRGIAVRIVEQEMDARVKLRRDFGLQLADRLWRALGTLRHAQIISIQEALDQLSLVRLGVDLELLPPLPRPVLNALLVSIWPHTLQLQMGEVAEAIQGDMMRARRIRQELAENS